MSSLRQRFEENYVAVDVSEGEKVKIKYIYYGPWYMWDIPKERVKHGKYMLCFLCILNIVLFAAGSLRETRLNAAVAIEVPCILSLITLMFEIIGIIQFCATGDRFTRMLFHDINMKLRIAPVVHAALLAMAILVGAYELLFVSFSGSDLVVVLLYLCCAFLSASIGIVYRRIPFTSERNRVLEEMAAKEAAPE